MCIYYNMYIYIYICIIIDVYVYMCIYIYTYICSIVLKYNIVTARSAIGRPSATAGANTNNHDIIHNTNASTNNTNNSSNNNNDNSSSRNDNNEFSPQAIRDCRRAPCLAEVQVRMTSLRARSACKDIVCGTDASQAEGFVQTSDCGGCDGFV